VDDTRIIEELRQQAIRFGWPETELSGLVRARAEGLASFWTRLGETNAVQVSPDTAPGAGRAQRIEVKSAGQGIAQWAWLPLHRQRQFEFEIWARSPDIESLTVSLWANAGQKPVASSTVPGLSGDWRTLRGRLTVPADLPSDAAYRFSVTADTAGQFIIGHAFLRPADHVHGADPDIVRLLRESHLPLLRWPGGNFVSTYPWQDGVGPLEQRPTKPNYAWGGVEPNTFGTDEFIALCRAIKCEPMICINAGSGSPQEAAQWIEYCNGSASSPMGRLRAANGHPEPFDVRYWEVGNELWGRWQMNWTTASGYVDRFKRFSAAMLEADRSIKLYACGAPAMSDYHWNKTLIQGVGASLPTITDHPLIGGGVPSSTEPLDVYRDFMAVPEVLQRKWSALKEDMLQGGIKEPRLAVTELQLFAHIERASDTNLPVRLTRDKFPSQGTITEAIYDVLIYHAAVRLAPFVELVTHSATVNHGGGLRKERERVWANPCHYAQATFADLAEATPVATEIETAMSAAPMILPDLKKAAESVSYSAVDALAAVAKDGSVLVSAVNRTASSEPLHLTVELSDFKAGASAELRILTATAPWDENTLEHPTRIQPVDSQVPVRHSRISMDVPSYSVLRLRVARE
jgi:alpha-N-arabinofuranosidase